MSKFDEAKAKLRGFGGDDDADSALGEMRDQWADRKSGPKGETPMKQHHKDAEGCGRSVGFQFAEDTKVPGEDPAGASSWSDILEREGKKRGKSLFSFDSSGKPVVNMRVQPPPDH